MPKYQLPLVAYLYFSFFSKCTNLKYQNISSGYWSIHRGFLYNSRHIDGRYAPFIDVVLGTVYMIPLLVGYIFITDTWPDPLLLMAGAFFLPLRNFMGK